MSATRVGILVAFAARLLFVATVSGNLLERSDEPINVVCTDCQRLTYVLFNGAEVYVCRVARLVPNKTSDERIERGSAELKVLRVLKGRPADTLVLAYAVRLTFCREEIPIWPSGKAAVTQGTIVLCVVVPGAYNAVAEATPSRPLRRSRNPEIIDAFDQYLVTVPGPVIRGNPDGAASFVAPVMSDHDALVKDFEKVLELDGVKDAELPAALVRISPAARGVVAEYVAEAAVDRVAIHDLPSCLRVLENLWEHPPDAGSGWAASRRVAAISAIAQLANDPLPDHEARCAVARLACNMLSDDCEEGPARDLLFALERLVSPSQPSKRLTSSEVLTTRLQVRILQPIVDALCHTRGDALRDSALSIEEWMSEWRDPTTDLNNR